MLAEPRKSRDETAATERAAFTREEFPVALGAILREQYGNHLGNVILRPILSQVQCYSYEALRLMLRGERTLTMEAIEGISEVVGISPHYFLEYRHLWCVAAAAKHPELADSVYEAALRFVAQEEGRSLFDGAAASSADGGNSRASR